MGKRFAGLGGLFEPPYDPRRGRWERGSREGSIVRANFFRIFPDSISAFANQTCGCAQDGVYAPVDGTTICLLCANVCARALLCPARPALEGEEGHRVVEQTLKTAGWLRFGKRQGACAWFSLDHIKMTSGPPFPPT